MIQLLDNPTRNEVRDAVAGASPGDVIEFRSYLRSRAYSWARRFGWVVKTRMADDVPRRTVDPTHFFLRFVEQDVTLRPGKAAVTPRQRMDDLEVRSSIVIETAEYEAFLALLDSLPPKCFGIAAEEGGRFLVQRLEDA